LLPCKRQFNDHNAISHLALLRSSAFIGGPTVLLCRRAGVREVASDLGYPAILNFYRILYKAKDLDEFPNLEKMPSGKPIYVLPEEHYADFIRTEGLQVAWHGPTSGLVVAIRPGGAATDR
jgi:hypothetical protein